MECKGRAALERCPFCPELTLAKGLIGNLTGQALFRGQHPRILALHLASVSVFFLSLSWLVAKPGSCSPGQWLRQTMGT